MSCIEFKEIHNGRIGSDAVEDGLTKAQLVRVFRAKCEENTDDATVVAAHPDCPSLGAVHPNFTYAWVKNRTFNNESNSKVVWIVTVTYNGQSKAWAANPLDDPAKITWRSEQFQRVAFKDKDDNAIVNSAGDFYDPPPERDDSRWAATVVKNLSSVPLWLLEYQDAINAMDFEIDGYTVEARKAKVQAIEISDWQYRNDIAYRQLTLTILCSNDGFELEILDQGFNYDNGGTRTKITVPDADGNQVEPTAPVLLDGSGGILANPGPSTAKFNTHYVYKEKDFGMLPLK